jgi:bifunctional non-homologous end joining protein LigD
LAASFAAPAAHQSLASLLRAIPSPPRRRTPLALGARAKLDGYRLQIIKEGRNVRLYSRRGNDWTRRLVTVADALKGIACRSAIIDGELVLPDAEGRPDFAGLHRGWRSAGARLAVFAFDLLHRDGKELRVTATHGTPATTNEVARQI